MSPTVTIIIPNYNHALYLKQRIDSVLSQTFQDFEVIILDDCSVDQSRKIITEYKDHPKIREIIYNEENSGGVFKQWIKGIEKAKGEYIWIAESDDYATENFLEETLKVIQKHADIGMVFTNSNTVNSNGQFLETIAESKEECYDLLAAFGNTIDHKNVSLFLVSEMVIGNASSVLFRKSSLLSVDFKELAKFVNTGDRFVYIAIALKSKIFYIPQALNFMRSHEHNTTKKSFENGNIHKDRLRVLDYYFPELYDASPYGKKVIQFYKNNYLNFITHGNYEDNAALLKKMKGKKEIPVVFYHLVRGYLYLFRKAHTQSKMLRSVYYRVLLLQHHFNKEYQK